MPRMPPISKKHAAARRHVHVVERKDLARDLAPYDEDRQARLQRTSLLDVAIAGKFACLGQKPTQREINQRRRWLARQEE